MKVLFITGAARSGSTLIGDLLAQMPGAVHVGELIAPLWRPHDFQSRLCGCRVEIRRCEFWRRVFERAFETTDEVGASYLVEPMRAAGRIRHLLMSTVQPGRAYVTSRLKGRLNGLQKLFEAIGWASGAEIVIDSSKHSTYGLLLAAVPGIDLHVLHVVRDPRAVAYSWTRRKFDPASHDQMPYRSLGRSTLFWILWDPIAQRFWRSFSADKRVTLRYEDFAERPEAALRPLLRMLGMDESGLSFVSEGRVDIRPSHTLAGNPDRFSWDGPVEIKTDVQWARRMRWKDQLVVTLMTWPWLRRYGYPLVTRTPSSPSAE